MDNVNEVDILENILIQRDERLLPELLADRSSGKNIIWATDIYASLGEGYEFHDEITVEKITGENGLLIRPRVKKSLREQIYRSREKGEIFTPAWMCNFQNNVLDEEWYGEAEVFNRELEKDWLSVARPVPFPSPTGKTWKDYVRSRRMEITCGEAPYLVSRYDATTGVVIPEKNRIGILDRKLRVVNENTKRKKDWYVWARQAFCSTYAYEWQGDSLLLARENLLLTYLDYFKDRWDESEEPDADEFLRIAEIISWNIWQMDGLKGVVPDSCHEEVSQSKDFFEGTKMVVSPCLGCSSGIIREHNGIFCVLRDWEARGKTEPLPFVDFLTHLKTEPSSNMKFDYIIGNPPYQEDTQGTSDKPVYDSFMSVAYSLSNKVLLITPARFLFNAGKTPKSWNKKMLSDPHFKVSYYEQDSSRIFTNTDIKGGVAITYHDTTKHFGPIGIFSTYSELRSLTAKITPYVGKSNLSHIMYLQNRFNLERLFADFPELQAVLSSEGKERRIVSSAFEKLPIFHDSPTNNDIKILGIMNSNKRSYRYVLREYVEDNGNLCSWKVLLPKSNGSGAIGEVLSTPLVGYPLVGYTQSFIGIGSFESEYEAVSCLKYVKGKFSRAMLGVLKITQDNPPEKWKYVPLQDFTSSSDIDWTKSIPEIDRQLYAKYGLDEKEIEFIETHVKEMQ